MYLPLPWTRINQQMPMQKIKGFESDIYLSGIVELLANPFLHAVHGQRVGQMSILSGYLKGYDQKKDDTMTDHHGKDLGSIDLFALTTKRA